MRMQFMSAALGLSTLIGPDAQMDARSADMAAARDAMTAIDNHLDTFAEPGVEIKIDGLNA